MRCHGVGDQPCPQHKMVVKRKKARGPLRCPDCYLENKRRMVRERLPELRQEQRDRLTAIGPAPAWVEAALRAARRCGHTLGAFKGSSATAASTWIARCTGCDTYVTIASDGKVSGPATRHDCLAANIGAN